MRFFIAFLIFVLFSSVINAGDVNDIKEYYKKYIKYISNNNDSAKFFLQKSEALANITVQKGTVQERYKAYFYLGVINKRKENIDIALSNFNKCLEISLGQNDSIFASRSLGFIGDIYKANTEIGKALAYYKDAIKYRLGTNDFKGLIALYNNIANLYLSIEDYTTAEEYYQKAINLSEETNNIHAKAIIYNGLGLVYDNLSSNRDTLFKNIALKYFLKSYKNSLELNNRIHLAKVANSLGSLYSEIAATEKTFNNYSNDSLIEKSIEYYKISLQINTEIGSKKDIAGAYINMGVTYLNDDNIEKSIPLIEKSIIISKENNDDYNLAIGLFHKSRLLYKQNKINKVPSTLYKSIKLAEKTNNTEVIMEAYLLLAKTYEKQNHLLKAYRYIDLYRVKKDSLYNEEKNKIDEIRKSTFNNQLEDAQNIYTAKLEVSEAEKEKAKLVAEKSKLYAYVLAVGVLAVLIIVYLLYKDNKRKVKTNKILNKQKEELNKQNIEIQKKNEIVISQKNELETINKEVKESIEYAHNIQRSTLPDISIISEAGIEAFVLFRPRDIVSGDYYWWHNSPEGLIITVADCTGHGVPGAFMSMLGISLLKEIIVKGNITKPAQILNNLREEVINSLKQKGMSGEQKDGMDMTIVKIKDNVLEYAGANNSLYLVSGKAPNIPDNYEFKTLMIENNKNILYDLKTNKMPIGIYEKMDDFDNYTIEITKNDVIYLFSDGFADQFGGPNGKKYKYKPFKEILIRNTEFAMQEQRNNLLFDFESWKADQNQVDDVTVMGIRI